MKLLSINCYQRPYLIAHKHGDNKNIRLKALLDYIHLSTPDIICLQEMWYKRRDFIKAAKKLGYICIVQPKSSFIIDSGLLILSKYTCNLADELVFKSSKFPDNLASKGCLYTVLNIEDGKQLHLFNTHLQSSYNIEEKLTTIQRKQVVEILSFIKSKVKEKEKVILCGDFNTVVENISTYFKDYVEVVENRPTVSIHYDNNENIELTTSNICLLCKKQLQNLILRQYRLDQIWTRNISYSIGKIIESNKFSDHYGIILDFDIKKTIKK